MTQLNDLRSIKMDIVWDDFKLIPDGTTHLVLDTSIKPVAGNKVVGILDGEIVVRQFPDTGDDFHLFGVATEAHFIR